MAYKSDDIQECVGIINPDASVDIRVSTVKDKDGNLKSIDIRQYYTHESGEKRPTPKGVRIKEEDLTYFLELLLNNVNVETLMDVNTNRVTIEVNEDDET